MTLTAADTLAPFTLTYTFPAAFALLPRPMDNIEARAMLIAIGLQESRFQHRRQISGPARGFFQFERGGGVAGVLSHAASARHAEAVCERLRYQPEVGECYMAVADNDVLACCFARLLLWTLPMALPDRGMADDAWQQYIAGWRPGRPHRSTWDNCYARAWSLVQP